MKYKTKGKLIVIAVDDIDEGSVASIVAVASAVSQVKAVEVFDSGEVRISRVCPVFTMDGLVRAAKRGEIPGSDHVDETCLGWRVCEEVQ